MLRNEQTSDLIDFIHRRHHMMKSMRRSLTRVVMTKISCKTSKET